MKPMLDDEKLVNLTNANVFQVIDSAHALQTIQLNISDEQVPAIMHYTTAPKEWDYLFNTYTGANRSCMFTGITQLALIKFERAPQGQGNFASIGTSHSNYYCCGRKIHHQD